MPHLLKNSIIVFSCLLLIFVRCTDTKSPEASDEIKETKEQQNIQTRNSEVWEEVDNIIFSETDFLKTKELMSDEAIEPIDYETGLVGDKAYNRKVYVTAIERIKKHSYIKDNQVYTTLKSGMEVNIAEDLFNYIVNKLYKEWNKALKEGKYEVVFDENELFHMIPIQKKSKFLSTPYNLLNMNDLERLNALKSVYDSNPTGNLSNYIVLNFGQQISGYSGNNQYFAENGCAAFGNPDNNCYHNLIAYSNNASYVDRVIYKVYNTNHLVLITVQIMR